MMLCACVTSVVISSMNSPIHTHPVTKTLKQLLSGRAFVPKGKWKNLFLFYISNTPKCMNRLSLTRQNVSMVENISLCFCVVDLNSFENPNLCPPVTLTLWWVSAWTHKLGLFLHRRGDMCTATCSITWSETRVPLRSELCSLWNTHFQLCAWGKRSRAVENTPPRSHSGRNWGQWFSSSVSIKGLIRAAE